MRRYRMVPFNFKVLAKFGLCWNCSQKLDECSLVRGRKIFVIACMLGFSWICARLLEFLWILRVRVSLVAFSRLLTVTFSVLSFFVNMLLKWNIAHFEQHMIFQNNIKLAKYISLTNRVRGPYGKLRTEFFPPSIYGPSAKCAGHKSKGKKRGSVIYSTDREDEVIKIFIISLLCAWRAFVNDFYSHGTASNFWRTSKAKRANLKSFLSR